MTPVWIAVIIYYISIVQLQNYVVFQALQSDRRFGYTKFEIPAASYIVFAMLSLTIWVRCQFSTESLSLFLQKYTKKQGGITILQRMGIGIVLSVVIMFASGLVEYKRRHIAITRPPLGFESRVGAISPMSGLWLVLVLSGLSEAFCIIAANEFFYKHSPENMRSIAMALLFCGMAISSYLSSFLSSIVDSITGRGGKEVWLAEDLNKGRLDYFYYLIGVLEMLNLIYFLICSRMYKYKEDDKNKELGFEMFHNEDV